MGPSIVPSPPAFWTALPKAVQRRIAATDALHALSAGADGMRFIRTSIALDSLNSAHEAARIQQRRIARARATVGRLRPVPWPTFRQLFFKIHFYLICWNRVYQLADMVATASALPQPRLILKGRPCQFLAISSTSSVTASQLAAM